MARKPQSNKIKAQAAEIKYVGEEPTWAEQPAEDKRMGAMVQAMNWYNYTCDSKQAKEMMLDYLKEQGKTDAYKVIKNVSDTQFSNTIGWLCRMSKQGLELNEKEVERINFEVERHNKPQVAVEEAEVEVVEKSNKPTIQDRMREKALEIAGELEGLYDDFIASGCKMGKTAGAIEQLKIGNPLPQHIPLILELWEKRLAELLEVQSGEDPDLNEGYAVYGKIEIRNMIKFVEAVIAECSSYVQYKKVSKTPRRKKPVPPEKVVAKLKYQKEFGDIKSEKPVKILGAKEMFVYNTKNRKLQYYVADQHSGGLYVKNNAIIGYDPTLSVMKTLRKPEEQIKELNKASKPNSRKFFTDIRAVEAKVNGRFNENLVILRIH